MFIFVFGKRLYKSLLTVLKGITWLIGGSAQNVEPEFVCVEKPVHYAVQRDLNIQKW